MWDEITHQVLYNIVHFTTKSGEPCKHLLIVRQRVTDIVPAGIVRMRKWQYPCILIAWQWTDLAVSALKTFDECKNLPCIPR